LRRISRHQDRYGFGRRIGPGQIADSDDFAKAPQVKPSLALRGNQRVGLSGANRLAVNLACRCIGQGTCGHQESKGYK